MNFCGAFSARLGKSGASALAVWALITIPFPGRAEQGKTLKDALEKNRYSRSIENGQLVGTGTVVRKNIIRPHAAISSSRYSWCSPPRTSLILIRQAAGNSCR